MPTDGQQASASARATDRITQLKPPAQLDFDATNLADSWKRWKQELELYMDLAMCGKDEVAKVVISVFDRWSRERSSASERSLTQVLAAFDTHCNPKKNETVERFKFFSRSQNPGESQEKFITDLKLLATTCNFGDLKDSLVRDRIICGIQDRQLREELLKIPDLDLQRCLSVCRATELSKTRTKTLEESEAVNSLKEQTKGDKVPVNKRRDNSHNKRRETSEQDAKDFSRKEIQRCKFCGGKHRAAKKSCPAFGKSCSFCGRMNHFASRCFTKTKVILVESEPGGGRVLPYISYIGMCRPKGYGFLAVLV